jgi:hypothetical protein
VALKCFPDYPEGAQGALELCEHDLARNSKYSEACLAAGVALFECKSEGECGGTIMCDEAIKQEQLACSPPSGELCTSWGAKYAECYMKPVDQASYYGLSCERAIWEGTNEDGPECGAAREELYACLAALDCATFLSDTRCEVEVAKVFDKCPL